MALLLPPVIRPYWSVLLKEKASAPAHRDWEFSSDPFAAQKEVENRQKKRQDVQTANGNASGAQVAGRYDESVQGNGRMAENGGGSGPKRGWANVPEVKMTVSQRELAEDVIRKVGHLVAKYGIA